MFLGSEKNEVIRKNRPLDRGHGLEAALGQSHPDEEETENQEGLFKFQIADFISQIEKNVL
jgi:hypothetical protein